MRTYQLSTFQSRRLLRKRRRKFKKLLWFFGAGIIGILFLFRSQIFSPFSSASPEQTADPISVNAQVPASPTSIPSPSETPLPMSASLKEAVSKSLEGTTGTYAVAIKNLKTGETYSLNESRVFDAGSLYKLWIMAVVYNKIENSEFAEDDQLSRDISALNEEFNIDPDLAEQTEGTITLSVKSALNQMITISHNYSALLLTEKIKLSTVATFLKDEGFNNSKVGTNGDAPTTTASDIASFYEKLYKGELGNPDSTNKMITMLKNQQLNNKLPKNLPEDVVIAHKTGELGWFSHDAGIVYSDKGDYIIVALSESSSPAGAEDRIASLSKTVFNYFENEKK